MQINKFEVFNTANDKELNYMLNKRLNVLYSDDNKKGKTSRFRLMMWAFGFDTEFPKTFKASTLMADLSISHKGSNYTFRRTSKSFSITLLQPGNILESGSRSIELRSNLNEMHRDQKDELNKYFISEFGISFYLLEVSFISIFLEQDYAFKNMKINKRVSGKYSFNKVEFLSTLFQTEQINDNFQELKDIERKIEDTNQTLRAINVFYKIPKMNFNVEEGEEKALRKISLLSEKKVFLLNTISALNENSDDNNQLINLINKLGVEVKTQYGVIKVNKDNILGIESNNNAIHSSINKYNIEVKKIEKELNSLYSLLKKSNHHKDYKARISTRIAQVAEITDGEIQYIESDLKVLKKQKESLIAEIELLTEGALKTIQDDMMGTLSKLGSENKIINLISDFTHSGTNSGVEKPKFALAFAWAIRNIVVKQTGFEMPFIIDSPYQQEISGNKTAGKISNLLMEFNDVAQVIVFSATMQNEIDITNANMIKVENDLY